MKPGEPLVAVQLDHLVATLRSSPFLLELRGAVQHYAWGGTRFIPDLLGLPNPEQHPFAEWWVGSNPSAPAGVRVGREWLPITDVIGLAGDGVCGTSAAGRFGPGLPYLAKVLDVAGMLSIQAHPNRAQAEAGFAREKASGTPTGDPTRNYKDPNHKPEASVALTDFWMLFGFKAPAELASTIEGIPEFGPLFGASVGALRACGAAPSEARAAIRRVYETAMLAPAADVDRTLSALATRLSSAPGGAGDDRSSADFWARRGLAQHPPRDGHFDRGLFSVFLLNLAHLSPGEAVFIPAGVPHAYLEGVAVEVMANSDNVLRGGLTPKHVDVDELLRVLTFEPTRPNQLASIRRSDIEQVYRAPVDEFEIARLTLGAGQTHAAPPTEGADLLLVFEGEVTILGAPRPLTLGRGGAALATHGLRYHVQAGTASLVFVVRVPSGRHA